MARWDKITERGKVDDRRMNRPVAIGGAGIGIVALILIYGFISGTDVSSVLSAIPTASSEPSEDAGHYEGTDEYELFVSEVIGSGNTLWSKHLQGYEEPTTVLFRGSTTSACGGADASVGPHYCPADNTIYLDETFFAELKARFGARGGDVAEAYVLAHELGHHVQNQRGTSRGIDTNEESIALELQADCYAGVWAHSVEDRDIITRDEVDQAIDAAEAVGDDRIQQKTAGRINPESWTHGSSAQRKEWFMKGFASGDPDACNTFDALGVAH